MAFRKVCTPFEEILITTCLQSFRYETQRFYRNKITKTGRRLYTWKSLRWIEKVVNFFCKVVINTHCHWIWHFSRVVGQSSYNNTWSIFTEPALATTAEYEAKLKGVTTHHIPQCHFYNIPKKHCVWSSGPRLPNLTLYRNW